MKIGAWKLLESPKRATKQVSNNRKLCSYGCGTCSFTVAFNVTSDHFGGGNGKGFMQENRHGDRNRGYC